MTPPHSASLRLSAAAESSDSASRLRLMTPYIGVRRGGGVVDAGGSRDGISAAWRGGVVEEKR